MPDTKILIGGVSKASLYETQVAEALCNNEYVDMIINHTLQDKFVLLLLIYLTLKKEEKMRALNFN